MIDILRTIWEKLLFLSFYGAAFSLIWYIFDLFYFLRSNGKLKRGIKVWSSHLSQSICDYLCSFYGKVFEYRESKYDFFRVQNSEVMISYLNQYVPGRRSGLVVGYVEISNPNLVLEFRVPLSLCLFLLPFVLSIYGIPFVLVFLFLGFYPVFKNIEGFINRMATENNK